jgi:hypothetical protein
MQHGCTGQRDGSFPGQDGQREDSARFQHATQNGIQAETYELFIF